MLTFADCEGDEAGNLCAMKFCAVKKYYIGPLLKETMAKRLARERSMPSVPTYTTHSYTQPANGVPGSYKEEQMTLQQIVNVWSVRLQGPFTALVNGHWQPRTEKNWQVSLSAYKPTVCEKDSQPFLLSFDNAACHSAFKGVVQAGRHQKSLVCPCCSSSQCQLRGMMHIRLLSTALARQRVMRGESCVRPRKLCVSQV